VSDKLPFGEVIYSYTRAQALEDGVLVDVSAMAKEAGFKYPVAVTAALWAQIQAIPARVAPYQDPTGRLWDVLWMASRAARRNNKSRLEFQVILDTEGTRKRYKTYLADIGPGDDAAPVITIGEASDF
jgi:hypothetical protein